MELLTVLQKQHEHLCGASTSPKIDVLYFEKQCADYRCHLQKIYVINSATKNIIKYILPFEKPLRDTQSCRKHLKDRHVKDSLAAETNGSDVSHPPSSKHAIATYWFGGP